MEAVRRHCRIRQPLVRECLAELIGTMTLVFIGDSAIANNLRAPSSTAAAINVPLGYAAGLAISVYATGGVSGGHLNPAVTLALCLTGRCRWNRLLPFTLVQFIGAFLGAALTNALHFDLFKTGCYKDVFATYPAEGISTGGGAVDQILGTALLMYGIMAVTDRANMGAPPALTPLAVGLTLFTVITCTGNNTGAAVNPARDLSPRIYSLAIGCDQAFTAGDHFWWIPVVCGYVGGVVGGLFYLFSIELHHPTGDDDNHEDSNRDDKPLSSMEGSQPPHRPRSYGSHDNAAYEEESRY